MNQETLPTLPVVIVGKDRTRMTCAVIDNIKAHIKNAKPYFICVSDRSREGHNKVVENYLKSIGETQYRVLRTLPEENRYGWGSAINIGLSCAFDVCNEAICALVVDNDWILQRDLDIDKYLYAFDFSNIGAITFKPIHAGTNIETREINLTDSSRYLLRSPTNNERYSFTAEIGCMLITMHMVSEYGKFKENCRTDDTEWGFCNWYNALTEGQRSERQLWFATDKDLLHTELNGEGHVFTHIGLNSQHEGPHKWNCPEEYKYLSDDKADEQVCKSVMNSLIEVEDEKEKESEGFWKKNKVLFATNTNLSEKNPLRLSYDLVSSFIPQENIYCVPETKFGKEAFIDIFNYGIDNGYKYIVYFDADCFIINEKNLRQEFKDFAYSEGCIFSGASDGGMMFHRCNNPIAINPFLLFININLVHKYRYDSRNFDFGNTIKPNDSRRYRKSIESFELAYDTHQKEIYDKTNLPLSVKEAFYTQAKKPYTYDYNSINFEPYYDIFLGERVLHDSYIRFLLAGDYSCAGDESGITSAIWTSRGGYSPENIICIHTWYSRVVLNCELEHISWQDKEFHKKRILSVVEWVRGNYLKEEVAYRDNHHTKIDWRKYFDKVYCMCFLDEKQLRIPRLKEELSRIDLLGSPVFEMKYCVNSPLFLPIEKDTGWEVNRDVYKIYSTQYLSVVKEAYLLGYKRILILEDDCVFLKDKNLIEEALKTMPSSPMIQMDKFVWTDEQLNEIEKAKTQDTNWFFSNTWFTSSTCNAFDRVGMEAVIECIERNKWCADHVGRLLRGKCAVAKDNICIQIEYPNSKEPAVNIHDCYRREGIDQYYSKYNVPQGYCMGAVYNPVENKMYGSGYSKKKPKGSKFISVYAIARNEASVAARWYECVKEADEVCVLDTGSTDDTVKILRDLGARVEVKTYDEWSFAVARNDSMKLVSPNADILFTLDLDETIAPGWRKKLEDAWEAEQKKGNVPVGCLYKYIWSWRPDGTDAQAFSVRKIHANGTGKWKYRCHELLTEVDGKIFFLDDFVVEHHQNKATNRSKYLPLLEKDAKEMPNDDRSAYYYARELMYSQRWEEAKNEFKRHLSLPSAGWRAERASSMRNIAKCYEHLNNEDERELWLWKSAAEDPTNREATYQLGIIAMNKKDYRTAVKVLEQCLAIEKPSLEYISDPMCWTAHPWFMYSQALWWTGHWEEAVEVCKKAESIEPDNPLIKDQLTGMTNTAKHYGYL